MGEFKQILYEIFDVLGLSDQEKERANDIFKKKLAADLLASVQSELPQEDQQWIASQMSHPNPADPKIAEVKARIGGLFSETALYDRSRIVFKKIVADYVKFMSEGLEEEKASKIRELADKI